MLRLDAQAGTYVAVAGNGQAGLAGDGGLAVMALLSYPQAIAIDASDNLYISDSGNGRVRKASGQNGIIITVVGGANAPLGPGDGGLATQVAIQPFDLVTDPDGDLYIADTTRVRKVDRVTGIITTIAGITALDSPVMVVRLRWLS